MMLFRHLVLKNARFTQLNKLNRFQTNILNERKRFFPGFSELVFRSEYRNLETQPCLHNILNRSLSTSPGSSQEKTDLKTEPSSPKATPVKLGRLQELWQKYGVVFIGIYGSLYVMALGTIYELVASKYLDAHSAIMYLHSIGLDRFMDVAPITNSKLGTFALAWVITKFTEPIRLAVTVAITPTIARYLGRAPPKKIKVH